MSREFEKLVLNTLTVTSPDSLLDNINSIADFLNAKSTDEQITLLTTPAFDDKNILQSLLVQTPRVETKEGRQQFAANQLAIFNLLREYAHHVGIKNYLLLRESTHNNTPLHLAARNLAANILPSLLAVTPIEEHDFPVYPFELILHNDNHYEVMAECLRLLLTYYGTQSESAAIILMKQHLIDRIRDYVTESRHIKESRRNEIVELTTQNTHHLISVLTPLNNMTSTEIIYQNKASILASFLDKIWGTTSAFWVIQALIKMQAEKNNPFYCQIISTDTISEAANIRTWANELKGLLTSDPTKIPVQFFIALQMGVHWTPLAFEVRNGKVNILSFDAIANTWQMKPYLDAIESSLGDLIGDIYCYVGDDEKGIQSDEISCIQFTLMHIFTMSQFLIFDELIKSKTAFKKVGENFYKIRTSNLSDQCVKLLPVTQSWTQLNSLPETTKNTVVSHDGTTLVEAAEKHSVLEAKKKLNKTIEYYKVFFSTLLVDFLGEITDDNFVKLQARFTHCMSSHNFDQAVTWETNRNKSLIKKAQTFSELLIVEGLSRENILITTFAVLAEQLQMPGLLNFQLDSIETQITTTLEKGMRYINQVAVLQEIVSAALKVQIAYENSKKLYAKSSLEQEQQLAGQIMLANDPDKLKQLLINYFKTKTSFFSSMIGTFLLTPFLEKLMTGINEHSAARRVFMESFKRTDLIAEELVSTSVREIGDAPWEIKNANDALQLFNKIVTAAIDEKSFSRLRAKGSM